MNGRSYSRLGRSSVGPALRPAPRTTRGMVMLELQLAILILGVGIGANLSIQTQALQRMIDSARILQAALQYDPTVEARFSPPDVL